MFKTAIRQNKKHLNNKTASFHNLLFALHIVTTNPRKNKLTIKHNSKWIVRCQTSYSEGIRQQDVSVFMLLTASLTRIYNIEVWPSWLPKDILLTIWAKSATHLIEFAGSNRQRHEWKDKYQKTWKDFRQRKMNRKYNENT